MLDQLIDVLALTPSGEDRFVGQNMHPNGFRVYGGQVLAQAVSAAQLTVEPDRAIHSQHAYFLREGDTSRPMIYEVERARDGGSFSSRRVVARQDDAPVLVSSMSFQSPSRGDEFQPEMPQVPGPQGLPSERELAIAGGFFDKDFMITTGEDLDVRCVDPIDWANPRPRRSPLQAWVKTAGKLPDNQLLHRAMLAYYSDLILLDACLILNGRTYNAKDMQIASLDHALWYHEDFRADQWLLHTVEAESVSGGRGLARGRFYTREGRLVATAMQQGLMRFR